MYTVRVTTPRYQQSRGYAGQVGEVIGHWGPESNEHGRDGYLVQFADGNIVGIADDEVETVSDDSLDGGAGDPSGQLEGER